jgi:hypothetical protein
MLNLAWDDGCLLLHLKNWEETTNEEREKG